MAESLPTPMISATPSGRRFFGIEAPWFIVIGLLLATLLLAIRSHERAADAAKMRFASRVNASQFNILQHFERIEQLNASVAGLITQNPQIKPKGWNQFIDAQKLNTPRFAGLTWIGYFSADRGLQHAWINPSVEDNGKSLDWPALAKNAAASNLGQTARQRGSFANWVSPLGQTDLQARMTLAITEPVTDTSGRLVGHIVSLIQIDRVITMLAAEKSTGLLLSFTGPANAVLPAKEQNKTPPRFMANRRLPEPFETIEWQAASTPQLERDFEDVTTPIIVQIGLINTLLLAGLIWLLRQVRAKAQALAEEMTITLRDQVKFSDDLIELNPNPIFRMDTLGHYLAVNRAWEKLFGRSRKEVVGKRDAEVHQPEVATELALGDERVLESTEGHSTTECVVRDTIGRRFDTVIARQVIRRADGSIDGLIGTITDVSPIKQLEDELARKREQLDLVIRASQQGIWDIELAPYGQTYFSAAFCDLLGYPQTTRFDPRDWETYLHPADRFRVKRALVGHLRRASPIINEEIRVKKSNAEPLWVRLHGIAQRNSAGKPIRLVGSIADISTLKAAEANMREANAKIIEVSKAKEAFFATMSHEIRTPMNGVLGMAALLAETPLSAEQQDYIHLIRTSGDTLLRIVDDVLNFSKIEAGHMTLESAPVDIIALAEETVELVAESAREKKLDLICEIDHSVPNYILGDATRLRQILLNLLSNAIKFTHIGKVTLSLSSTRTDEENLELTGHVTDTGIGIPAARAQQLFQPFTQADTSTTRQYGGTGLGLAITRRLTRLMHGDAWVQSQEGVGSTFSFRILTQSAHGPMQPWMRSNILDFLHRPVLLVSVAASGADALLLVLRQWGFDVIHASPETATLKLNDSINTDLIIFNGLPSADASTAVETSLANLNQQRAAHLRPAINTLLLTQSSRAELARQHHPFAQQSGEMLLIPTTRRKIYETLFRLLSQTSKLAKTTGTALRDSPQQGSTAEIGAEAASAPDDQEMQAFRILVAEDNEVNQRVIRGMLGSLGHQVHIAQNGKVAFELACKEPFDVILMDVHMPEMDGFEAMKAIRDNLKASRCPPIVALTAHALSGNREQFLQMGMDDYLSKPFKKSDLIELFERLQSSGKISMGAQSFEKDLVAETPNAHHAAEEITPILDESQLIELCELSNPTEDAPGDHAIIDELFGLFKKKLPDQMAALYKQAGDREFGLLADTAHSLRGASASMGFLRVARSCKQLETLARQIDQGKAEAKTEGSDAIVEEWVTTINQDCQEAEMALTTWLKKKMLPDESSH